MYTKSKPVIASNAATLTLSVSILVLKLHYDGRAVEKETKVNV
jgi:hypothetical protein